jgi:NADH:ubiquinone oxidoreductase subunit E
MGSTRQMSEFTLAGKFLGYEFKDGYKIKRLKLATTTGEYSIKMTKEARASLRQTLLPGEQIRVHGVAKLDRYTGNLKLKASWIQVNGSESFASVNPVASVELRSVPSTPPSNRTTKPGKTNILVCQKSGCMKRGGKEVCKALESALHDRGLVDEVSIKGTGCMKACGKGPNVVMPGKVRYTKISAKDIPSIIDEHFTIVPASSKPEAPARLVSV